MLTSAGRRFSAAVLALAIASQFAIAQATDPPLTDRERMMLERIQKLEQRLAELESKSSPPKTEASSPDPSSQSPPKPARDIAQQPPSLPPAPAQSPVQESEMSLNPDQVSQSGLPINWGDWTPGRGFKVASTETGDLNLSGYMVARYLNQLPTNQFAPNHLGQVLPVLTRQDFQFHRVLLYASGWFLDPKFKYMTFVWTVNDTTQVAVAGTLSYDFSKYAFLGLGMNALPVNRTLQGNHPYWPTYDRVMTDEFFRPFFTQGLFGGGQIVPRLTYKWMVGNNLSALGVRAFDLSRDLNFGGSLTWMPTTGEFGPRGALGDFEDHEKLATRFGAGFAYSRENRQQALADQPANNTTIRLADATNVFDANAFGPGITVEKVTYRLVAADVGFKKHGLWVGAEGYYRLLDNFGTLSGTMPVTAVRDTGFYVQAAYMVLPKKLEIYAGTDYVFSNYGRPKEFIVGGNWYPANNRNYRLNVHLINVDRSPVNSAFGFYTGLLTGQVFAVGVTALY